MWFAHGYQPCSQKSQRVQLDLLQLGNPPSYQIQQQIWYQLHKQTKHTHNFKNQPKKKKKIVYTKTWGRVEKITILYIFTGEVFTEDLRELPLQCWRRRRVWTQSHVLLFNSTEAQRKHGVNHSVLVCNIISNCNFVCEIQRWGFQLSTQISRKKTIQLIFYFYFFILLKDFKLVNTYKKKFYFL